MSDELHEVRNRYERLAYRAKAVVTAYELYEDQGERFEHAVANLVVELAQGDLGAPRSPLAEAVDEVTRLRARCKLLESALRQIAAAKVLGTFAPTPVIYELDRVRVIADEALGAARPTMATEAGSNGVAQDLASEKKGARS